MFLIEVEQDDNDELKPKLNIKGEGEHTTEKEVIEISPHDISDTVGCSTMKIEGQANNHNLQLLIDSGNTHNFFDGSFVKKLVCLMEYVPPL